MHTYDDGVRRGAAGPGGCHQVTAFINPTSSISQTTVVSSTHEEIGQSASNAVVDGGDSLASLLGYTARDSTYYRIMEGPDVEVHTWYVVLKGTRVGIMKDV